MQTITDPRPAWTPVITALPGGALVRITAVRAGEIVFDRVADLDGTTLSVAHGVPFSGYDPEADDLPSLDTVVAAIANPAPVPVTVPESVRSAALRYVLNGAGLRSAVETAIATAEQNSKDAWEYELNFRRDHPLVSALSGALGLTPAQIDALFVSASKL